MDLRLAALLFLTSTLASCSQGPVDTGRTPAIALSGMTLRHYAKEGVAKVATAAKVTFDRNTGVVAAEQITVDLPPSSEFRRGGAHLVAERGQGDIHGKGATIEGPIQATTGQGDVATTVGTVWDGERDLLFGDQRVQVRGPGYSLSGGNYHYDVSQQKLALADGVRFHSEQVGAGEKAPPPLDVRSPVLTVDHGSQQAVFSGGVVLTQGDLVVECPELVAHYDGGSRIRKVVCKGRVRAMQGARVMESSAGTFDNETGRLILEGEPVITEGERWIRGESVVWEVGPKIATVHKGVAELPAGDVPSMPTGGRRGPLQVTADSITHDSTSRTTSFSGSVIAKRGTMVLRASKLIAVSEADGGLDKAWTEGGPVSVVEGKRRATSGKALFAGSGSRLILSGQPRLTEESSSLEGSRVVFHIGLDRVEVEEPRALFPLEGGPGGKKR